MSEPPRTGRSARSRRTRRIVIAAIVAMTLIVAIAFSLDDLSEWDRVRFVQFGIIIVAMAARAIASRRSFPRIGAQVGFWLAIAAALALFYTYRTEISGVWARLSETIVPGHGVETAPGVLRFSADENGQFGIEAEVNGQPVRFIVDTGATGIVLTKRDAARAGIDQDGLNYAGQFSTANGTVQAAPVTLDRLQVGPIDARNVPAWVNGGELDHSLLGMSFLRSLGRIEIDGTTLTLTTR
jgi:aspartyl protease family protein